MLEVYAEFFKCWEELSELNEYSKKSTRLLEKQEKQAVDAACSKASKAIISYESAANQLQQAKSSQEREKARRKLKNEVVDGMKARVAKWSSKEHLVGSAVEKYRKKMKVS